MISLPLLEGRREVSVSALRAIKASHGGLHPPPSESSTVDLIENSYKPPTRDSTPWQLTLATILLLHNGNYFCWDRKSLYCSIISKTVILSTHVAWLIFQLSDYTQSCIWDIALTKVCPPEFHVVRHHLTCRVSIDLITILSMVCF